MKKRVISAFLFGLIFMFSGCAPSSEPTVTMAVPTSTATITESPAPSTATLSPTPQATTTLAPTWTPLPTLPPAEAREKFDELMQTNGGCELPCWWGITPGQTPWEEAKAFLSPFAMGIINGELNNDGTIGHGIIIKTTDSDRIIDNFGLTLIEDSKSGAITMITASKSYLLSEFLEQYGVPDQIWFHSTGWGMDSTPAFNIGLFYEDEGIFLGIAGNGKLILNDQGNKDDIICYRHIVDAETYLYLWQPNTLSEAKLFLYSGLSDRGNRKIADVTDLDTNSFYQMFLTPKLATCFISLSSYWP